MTIDISKLTAASFMPGLQNSGNVSGTIYISGTLETSSDYPNATSSMTNPISSGNAVPIIIPLPNPSVISVFRVNFPDAAGQLASRWFPLIGTGVFYDYTNHWQLLLYVTSHPEGRAIYFNFVGLTDNTVTFTDFPINIYGHLYSYPWK